MIYSVETKDQREYYSSAYEIVGDDEDIQQFSNALASLALEAVASGMISDKESYRFLRSLSKNVISVRDVPVLEKILEERFVLENERLRTLTRAAIAGALVSEDLMKEYKSLSAFSFDENCSWVNSDGLDLTINDDNGSLETIRRPIDSGYEEHEIAIAEELGLESSAFQFELVSDEYGLKPVVKSDRQHLSLGNIDDNGVFVPVVTVLDPSHPAVN